MVAHVALQSGTVSQRRIEAQRAEANAHFQPAAYGTRKLADEGAANPTPLVTPATPVGDQSIVDAPVATPARTELTTPATRVTPRTETVEVDDSAKVTHLDANLNSNHATSNFGLYEIETQDGLEKVGKADLNCVTLSSGLPTRLHQHVRKLEQVHGEGNVKGTVVKGLGETTTAAAKAAESARIKKIVDETGRVPPGNKKSYKR